MQEKTETRSVAAAAPGYRAPVRTVSILGATGSVGENALDLIATQAVDFEIVALTAKSNVRRLAELARQHGARHAVIADENLYGELKALLAGTDIQVAAGAAAVVEAASVPVDCVVSAIVGAAGLYPGIAAVRQGRRVALANKECLVTAGDIFMHEVAAADAELLPVDSEHAAIHQALRDERADHVERIIITASGGPFRDWTTAEIASAGPDQAVRHPKWSMGAKISVDSATMMNKGLELIEAYHLFPVSVDQLGVVVHPQSIVHCLVEFCDGSVIAQMANPDMRTPIAYSLAWPARMSAPTPRLDLVAIASLTFEEPDVHRFPALALAQNALATGGSAPNVLNAANECAVDAFLARRIGFTDIARTVERCLERADGGGLLRPARCIEDVVEIDRVSRQMAQDLI